MDKTFTVIEDFTVSYSPFPLWILQCTCHSVNDISLVCAEYITFTREKKKRNHSMKIKTNQKSNLQ